MRRALCICFGFFCMFVLSTPRPCRVKPIYYPCDYTPPENCFIYEIPESEEKGTHTVKLDCNNKFVFTVAQNKNSNTYVIRWDSNFPIYGILVKGHTGANLYKYNNHVRVGENLYAPCSNIVSVAIIYCICPTPTATKSEHTPSTTPMTTDTPKPTLIPTPTTEPPITNDNSVLSIYIGMSLLLISMTMFVIISILKNRR